MQNVPVIELKPSRDMIKLYHVYFVIIILICTLPWALPIILIIPHEYLAIFIISLVIPIILIVTIYLLWVYKYYKSIIYRVTNDRVYAKRGVLWIRESEVPISKINNVTITQGPLQRKFNLVNIGFHTAAMGYIRPEVLFNNLSPSNARRVRAFILKSIGKLTEEERKSVELEILSELREIRKILQESLLKKHKK